MGIKEKPVQFHFSHSHLRHTSMSPFIHSAIHKYRGTPRERQPHTSRNGGPKGGVMVDEFI